MFKTRDANWQIVTVGQLFRIETQGCVPAEAPRHSFRHYSLPAFDKTGGAAIELGQTIESNKLLLTEPCVLVSKLNPRIPRVVIHRPFDDGLPTCTSTEFIAYVPTSRDALLEFYAHYFGSSVFRRQLERVATGTTNSHVRLRPHETLNWRIPLPPREEQQAIASILDAVDEAIGRTRIAAGKAQRLKSGLMQQLFRSGVEGDGVAREKKKIRQFRATPFGRFPMDWEISNVESEFDIATGFTLGQHRRPQLNPRKYLRVANVQREFVNLDDVAELEAAEREMEGRRLEANDLLIVEGHADPGAIGRCAIVPPEASGMTFQNHLYRLRSLRLNPLFALFWLNSMVCRRYWRQTCATSSGLNTINQRKLKRLPVVVPPEPEQEMIADTISATNDLIAKTDAELGRLVILKRGLMQDLLTGKRRVNTDCQKPRPEINIV